jgi:DNA-directed RNA polymerase specialized sigma24 family protein
VSRSRDAEYTEYGVARLPSLRRLAAVLCDDWQLADDLVQATLIKLYVRWGRVRVAIHPDAYARAVLVREFIHERRSVWVKRVSLSGGVTGPPAAAVDRSASPEGSASSPWTGPPRGGGGWSAGPPGARKTSHEGIIG